MAPCIPSSAGQDLTGLTSIHHQQSQGHIAFSATLMPTMAWTGPQLVTLLQRGNPQTHTGSEAVQTLVLFSHGSGEWWGGGGYELKPGPCPIADLPWRTWEHGPVGIFMLSITPLWGEISNSSHRQPQLLQHREPTTLVPRHRQAPPSCLTNIPEGTRTCPRRRTSPHCMTHVSRLTQPSFDLPPTQIAKPLPVTTISKKKAPPPKKQNDAPKKSGGKRKRGGLDDGDGVPRAFKRLMAFSSGKPTRDGLDNGQVKRRQSAPVHCVPHARS